MGQETIDGAPAMRSRDIVRGALIGGLLGVLCGVAIGGVVGWIVQLMHRWRDDGTPPWESVAEEFSHAQPGEGTESASGEARTSG
jgi:NhaP-type Na+/H+ or K+/H+ antiporter